MSFYYENCVQLNLPKPPLLTGKQAVFGLCLMVTTFLRLENEWEAVKSWAVSRGLLHSWYTILHYSLETRGYIIRAISLITSDSRLGLSQYTDPFTIVTNPSLSKLCIEFFITSRFKHSP